MRAHVGLLAGLAVALASACNDTSSGTTTGTSSGGSGGGTTGGATTGGSSGGSSGGTTGGNLANGAACIGNMQCQSGICGVNGNGFCCTASCSTSHPTCGATGCDATGACVYPTVACGATACISDNLVQSSCDGAGACAEGTPSPCPNNFKCQGASACFTQCTSTFINCISGYYCDPTTSQCLFPQATGPCATVEACTSGICGLAGTGNCCSVQCNHTVDPACEPTGCDATTAACVFPAGNACGTASCTGNALTAGACDSSGICNVGTTQCASNLVCNPGGTACLAACATSADCVTGFYCNATRCVPKVNTGLCSTNEGCTSGICGVSGTGHCCASSCPTGDVSCSPKDCDNSGACTFPNNHTACGTPAGCTGSTQTDPTTCDGAGTCQPQGTTDCSPYVCGATACLTTCKGNATCVSGDFCDILNGACCTGLANGGAMSVDTDATDATACCGFTTGGSCQTLTHAMRLIDAAQAQNVTIYASVSSGGGDWTGETYPVVLGWGVELNAPGVYFLDAPGPKGQFRNETFDINFYSANDTLGYASIVGSAKAPVGVGMDSSNNQTDDVSAIQVEDKNKLYIANASVNGSVLNKHSTQAILLVAGATLLVGQDQPAGISGTVTIGNALGAIGTDGYQGIVCQSDGVSGCTITDAPLVGNSVVIQGQHQTDLLADDLATIVLTSSPVIGVPPTKAGFGECPQKNDGIGNVAVLVSGSTTMTFNNGVVQCIGGTAFQVQTSSSGLPSLSIDNSVIQNTEVGILAFAGTATVTNSTIKFNYIGVEQSPDFSVGNNGSIDLSGGGNTVACSSNNESSQSAKNPGMSVYNLSSAAMKADNVLWDTSAPDYFDCDPNFTTCVCNLATCTLSAGSDGMDAVEDSTNKGGISTTNASQPPTSCN